MLTEMLRNAIPRAPIRNAAINLDLEPVAGQSRGAA
jgi:hypothetical protein